ncbi:hypothetical protein MJO28_007982 [Puccinia striiformis f. sp. tritici]|uniref:Uncharacterized protein n=1 Tax=Puccinia striiformis f. sp. tritici TaxID=168172 RepID=A0ACC0EBD8_9BASI|nr:hypothetical protein MJO28_007982 [Puccinia striiformis f. sp. tritici]
MKVSQSFVVVSLSVAAQTQVSMASPVPDAGDLSFDSPQLSEAVLEEVTPSRLVPKGFGRRAHPSLMSLNPRARAVSLSFDSNGRVNHRAHAQADRSKLQNSIEIGDGAILNASLGAHRPIRPLQASDEHGLRTNLLDISLRMKKRTPGMLCDHAQPAVSGDVSKPLSETLSTLPVMVDDLSAGKKVLPGAAGVAKPLASLLGARAVPATSPLSSLPLSSIPLVSDLTKSLPASASVLSSTSGTGLPVLGSILGARSEMPDTLGAFGELASGPINPFDQETAAKAVTCQHPRALTAFDIMAAGGAFPIQPSHSLDGQTLPNESSVPNLKQLLADAESIRTNQRSTKKHHKASESQDESELNLKALSAMAPISSLEGQVPVATPISSLKSQLPSIHPIEQAAEIVPSLPVPTENLPLASTSEKKVASSVAGVTKPLTGTLGARSLPLPLPVPQNTLPNLPLSTLPTLPNLPISNLPVVGEVSRNLPVGSSPGTSSSGLPILGPLLAELPILGSLLKVRSAPSDPPSLNQLQGLGPITPTTALPVNPLNQGSLSASNILAAGGAFPIQPSHSLDGQTLPNEPSVPNFSQLMADAEAFPASGTGLLQDGGLRTVENMRSAKKQHGSKNHHGDKQKDDDKDKDDDNDKHDDKDKDESNEAALMEKLIEKLDALPVSTPAVPALEAPIPVVQTDDTPTAPLVSKLTDTTSTLTSKPLPKIKTPAVDDAPAPKSHPKTKAPVVDDEDDDSDYIPGPKLHRTRKTKPACNNAQAIMIVT